MCARSAQLVMSTSFLVVETALRGYHLYQAVWEPSIGKCFVALHEGGNVFSCETNNHRLLLQVVRSVNTPSHSLAFVDTLSASSAFAGCSQCQCAFLPTGCSEQEGQRGMSAA